MNDGQRYNQMARQNELGKKGEQLAKDFLEKKGYKILAENWRYSRAELDLIALDDDVLVIIEVKTRSYEHFGPPEDFVSEKKQRLMTLAGAAYMEKHHHTWQVRFDVISIIVDSKQQYRIQHFPDAFWPGL